MFLRATRSAGSKGKIADNIKSLKYVLANSEVICDPSTMASNIFFFSLCFLSRIVIHNIWKACLRKLLGPILIPLYHDKVFFLFWWTLIAISLKDPIMFLTHFWNDVRNGCPNIGQQYFAHLCGPTCFSYRLAKGKSVHKPASKYST